MQDLYLRPSLLLGTVLFGICAVLISKLRKFGSRPPDFVPGPPTEPIRGNARQLSNKIYPQHVYTELAKQYGPVYSIMKGNKPWIIVSGAAEAQEIFNKRGQLTAGRPWLRFQLLMRGGWMPGFMTGPPWRDARKLWHSILNVGASAQYLPYQKLEARKLVFDVCETPEDWRKHTERFSNSTGLTMMNGQRVARSDDPTIRETRDDLLDFGLLSLKSSWLDNFPWLYSLPEWAVPPRREAKKVSAKHDEVLWRLWDTTKAQVAKGMVLPSFNQSIMEKIRRGETRLSERQCTEVSYSLLSAATDTTASTLDNFVAAMILYPEAQKKAQEEVDRVVGPNRLPRDTDAANLPYIRQTIQELERWHPVAPLALDHATTAPMKWGPYTIPTGTGLILNTHAIHSDPTSYPNPSAFLPERWAGKLDAALTLKDDQVGARSELFAFGAGRRVCPGQHLAERSMFLAVAHWVWAFDTAGARDEGGREQLPDVEDVVPGFVQVLRTVRADVRPRSEGRRVLLRRAWEEEREAFLDPEEQWVRSPGEAVAG